MPAPIEVTVVHEVVSIRRFALSLLGADDFVGAYSTEAYEWGQVRMLKHIAEPL